MDAMPERASCKARQCPCSESAFAFTLESYSCTHVDSSSVVVLA